MPEAGTPPRWSEFAAGDPDKLLRYQVAPGTMRRMYFDKYVRPTLSGSGEEIQQVWGEFDAVLDGYDAKDGRRSFVPKRLKGRGAAEPMAYDEFLATQLDETNFTIDQYRESPQVRTLVRDAYFEAFVLPQIAPDEPLGSYRADAYAQFTELDKAAGRMAPRVLDPAAEATTTGLPSLTPTNLNSAREDDTLHQAIAKRAGRVVQAEEPGWFSKTVEGAMDILSTGGVSGAQWSKGNRTAPAEVQRRIQLQDIAREELAARLTQGGTKPEAVEVILNSPRGREIVRDTAHESLKAGAKLANAGDATWTRLIGDMKNSADRGLTDSMRKLSYTMLMNNMISREQAQAFWKSGEDIIGRIPEPLERGFWGQGVTDVAGMGPILTAGAIATMVGGPVGGALLFANEAAGGFYHYAIEEAGLPETAGTKALSTIAGATYGVLEHLQLKTATGAGGRSLSALFENALKKSGMKMQAKLALKSAKDMTAATAEQVVQEAAQQIVDVLHQELSDQKGIDWTRVGREAIQAAQQSLAPSILMTGGLGIPAHVGLVKQLQTYDSKLKEAVADVAKAAEENKSEAEKKVAEWQRKADNLRVRLGLIDAPQTTEGGPLPAPTVDQNEAPAEQPAAESFKIGDQPAVPGMVLEGPQGLVTVEQIVPDPETTEQVVVVRTASGDEMALDTAALAEGNYKPAVPAEAPAPEPVPEPVAAVQQEEPPVAETQAAPEPAPVVAESPAPQPAKPRTRKPKAASKPAVAPPAAPAKAPEPEAAKPEPAKALPAAEAAKVEPAQVEAEDDWTPADMGNTSLADPKPVVFSKFNVDLKRFQNREDKEGFSEETAESVYQQALTEGGLGFLKADPIVWWTDPKTKKRYILEGHSRYEGARRYKEKSGKKDLPVPAIEFRGTEAQAITKARTSNFRRTDETPLAASKFVAELKQEGASKALQERKAKEIGKRDHLTVLRLGQLARDGKAVTMLRATEKGAEGPRKQAASIAEWVGEARWRYTGLTDAHENEITDYLNDKYGERIKNQADALAIISDAVERHQAAVQTLIDPIEWESPINLASTETETVGDREFKRLLGEAKGELRDAEARRDKLTANRQKAVNDGRWQPADEELYRENFEKLTTARDEAWAAVRKLEESRPDFVQSIDERQIDLFAAPAPAKPKAPEEAAKLALSTGTYETAKPALVALGKQLVADGFNTLATFTPEIKRVLGENYSKLKGKLKDLWEAVKDESGFVRLPSLREMAGKNDQRGPARKFGRRVLTRDRGLGKATADLKDAMEGEMRAVRTLLDFKAKKFRKAMKAVYPKGYSMVELEKVHAALTDPQPLFQYQHLPPALVPVVKEMRATIDRLTQSLIDSGAAAELVDTLREHIGSYLTRSYRIFDDQKYLQEVLNAVSDINGQGSGRYGKDIGVKAVKAADYIRAAFTIPEGDDLMNMAWPDLLSLAAHRGLTVKGRTKAEVLADLQGMAERVPSDTAIRAMLTDLLDKARDATSQTAFRTGRQQGQMDLSSMLRRQEIPEVLRDLMGEHKDPLVNFYRSGLRISQQVAKWKFMNAVVAQGLKDGTLYRERTTGPDPFSPGLRANFDAPLGKKDDPTTAPFAGIYGTQEFVDALRRGFESKDQPIWSIRMMMRTGAAVKIGKTALSIDTTIRNFMGNPYFALMQGHVRFWEMAKAMRTAGAAFGRAGTLEDVVVDLVRRGVIGDTVFASEIAAFMRDAAIKSDGFETFHANIIEAVLGGGKKALNVSMGTYQMMDDIWKVYGYLHEVRRYEAVGKKKGWTTDQIRNRAAEIVKATYPSYSQLPELVQWFRLDPFVAPFVSFSASVARGHYMTARIAAEELADKDTRALGMIRIAGMTAAAVAYYGLKEIGQYLSGMDDDDDRAARKLLPPQDQDGNIIWLDDPMKSGNLHYINASYTVGGAYVLDAAMSVMRGAGAGSLEAGFTEAIRGLMDPWTSLDLVAQMGIELSSNTTGTTGRKILNPADFLTTEGLWNASGDIAGYIGGKAMPGIGRTLNSYKKALDGAIDLYGTEYTVGNATAKTLGWNAVTRDINQATAGSLRFLKSMQGNTIDGLVSAIKDDPTDDDIRDSARRMEKTRQVLWVKQYEVVQTAQRFGLSRGELRKVMDAAQFTKEAQQDLLSGRYRSWWTSGQFMEGTEKSILLGKAGKKGAAELTRRRKVLEDYLRVLKKEDFGVLPEGVKKR